MPRHLAPPRDGPGQTLVETALILPLFLLVVLGIIVFGIGLFYQQQVTTAAREAARFAALHSATAQDPVCGWLDPDPGILPSYSCADEPSAGWPMMTARAREFAFGMNPAALHVTACWSGHVDDSTGGKDAGPYWAGDPTGATPNDWADCTMGGGMNPLTDTGSLPCPAGTAAGSSPYSTDGDDKASNLAVSDADLAVAANRVVVYACYAWSPPMAGFLAIPSTIVLRAVVSEGLQHQR